MKKALITGITGQDGAYLSEFLLKKGYEVYGAFRRTSELYTDRLKYLGVADNIKFIPLELLEFTNICRTIDKIKPDEVYNLAAQSFVQLSFEEPLYTADVTAMGALRLLESIRAINPRIKYYQASSSEMFGKVQATPQNEMTPFRPRSPYSVSKLFGHWITANYRESYGIFACSGILFNHESPLRGLEFVTRKITNSIARIKFGLQNKMVLGNLDAKRDWGYSGDYVQAMWLMLQQEKPDDYVIATCEVHSVREFVEMAFKRVGIEIKWSGKGLDEKGIDAKTGSILVSVSPEFFRPAEVDSLTGECGKAKLILGWEPKVHLQKLVEMMVDYDLELVEREISIYPNMKSSSKR
jgi:GDPmannose 4,6-dehydratase